VSAEREASALARALSPFGLAAVGGFHPEPGDGAPAGTGTLFLVGPDGGAMWPVFAASPERTDGAPDPLDRWSRRVLDAVAAELGATALYPFSGPPWQPFVRWAARGEGSRPSPVKMPVSPWRGLWAAYRGALAFPDRLPVPAVPDTDPCLGCPAPCLTACPVDAFAGESYDVAACVGHAAGPEGAACRDGCLVRMACPVGAAPALAQRRFHMAAFLAAQSELDKPGS